MNAFDALAHTLLGARNARQIADDLWGLGFTIVDRQDPMLTKIEAPPGWAYGWCTKGNANEGWTAVPASRHDGLFAPIGYRGDIESGAAILMEKPREVMDAELATAAEKARRQGDDLLKKAGADGFVGEVKVQSQSSDRTGDVVTVPVGGQISSEHHTKIPPEMLPHLKEILAERDRLIEEIRGKGINPSPAEKSAALLSALTTVAAKVRLEQEAANAASQENRPAAG